MTGRAPLAVVAALALAALQQHRAAAAPAPPPSSADRPSAATSDAGARTGSAASGADGSDGGSTNGADRLAAAAARADADPAGAAAALEALADARPDDAAAPDALMAAAQLAEERLGRPDHALALYRRLVERYPSTRLLLRARARADALASGLATGVGPLVEYRDVLERHATRPPAESVARMERLLDAHPDFVLADRARLWLAAQALGAGHPAEATRRYREIARLRPGSAVELEARAGEARALLAEGRPLAARRLYLELLAGAGGDTALAAEAARGLAEARLDLVRLALLVAALAWLALFLVGGGWRARGSLLPLPVELAFYAPVAALFVAASLLANGAVRAAVATMALGGGLVLWVACARARLVASDGASRWRRALDVGAAALAAAALVHGAIRASHLGAFVLETLRNGPAR